MNSHTQILSNRIYIGNLFYAVQPQEIEQVLHAAGFTRINVDISIDPFDGRNPSYCFVDFATAADASRALVELQGASIRDRPLKVKPATARGSNMSVPRLRSWNQHGDSRQRSFPHNERVRSAKESPAAAMNWRQNNRAQQTVCGTQEPDPYVYDRWSRSRESQRNWHDTVARVRVSGLPRLEPQSFAQEQIKDIFRGFTVYAISKLISPNRPGTVRGPRGYNQYTCYVDLVDEREADRAVRDIGGATVDVAGGRGFLSVHKAKGWSNRVEKEQPFPCAVEEELLGHELEHD